MTALDQARPSCPRSAAAGPQTPLLAVEELSVAAGDRLVLDRVSFEIAAGEAVGLVGASGCGKTTTAMAVLGHLRPGMAHVGGVVRLRGQDVLPVPPPGLRGRTVAYLAQDPGHMLNPYQRIGAALLGAGGGVPRRRRAQVVARALERVGLPADRAFARRFPHELSGGQQQRVALALALRADPAMLVLDEPATGLDIITRTEVVGELMRVRASGVTLLWISHDLDCLAESVGRLLVLDAGRLVEQGPTARILMGARSDAARRLVSAGGPAGTGSAPGDDPAARTGPTVTAPAAAAGIAPVLAVQRLVARYGGDAPVLRGVDLTVAPGECVALLGASGIGKTTLARCLVGLHAPSAGVIRLDGTPLAGRVRRRSAAERARIQLVGQSPAEALHPRQTVRTALIRPLVVLRGVRRRAALDAEVRRLLSTVELDPAYTDRLPEELSGGERQRVALARALAARPDVLVCDECTSALDPHTQAAILDLLGRACRTLGLGVLLITHDLRVAATADRVLVMADGRVLDRGRAAEILAATPASLYSTSHG